MDTFRTTLRDACRTEHDHLDDIFALSDLTDPRDLKSFLSVHLSCFRQMQPLAVADSVAQVELNRMVAALVKDTQTLGSDGDLPPVQQGPGVDPLAMDYIIAGSRLGSKVLRRRWATATDPDVTRANAYFGLDSDPLYWQNTCSALTAIPPTSHRARKIVSDSQTLFRLFISASERSVAPKISA